VPLALGLREPSFAGGNTAVRDQSIFQALREAFAYRSFQLLMAGFFVCGFQVVFIAVHMPSFLKDKGLSPEVASISLALIGLFNVFGTYIAGSLGQRLAKRKILAFIYLSRSVAITLFLLAPLTPWSVYIFASVMGLLWLSTVPPTNAVIAQIFGIAHFSMLGGFVFFSHQIGSFMGVWLGGYLYDKTGSYDIVWYISIALGLFAAFVNLPVKENAIERQPKMATAYIMTDEPQNPSTDNITLPVQFGWMWLLGWGVASTVLIGVLSLYLQPTFLVTLASQVWACF
jgi:predicted MFS family arabinose efflux permease